MFQGVFIIVGFVAARLSAGISLSLVVGHQVRSAAKKKEGNDTDTVINLKKKKKTFYAHCNSNLNCPHCFFSLPSFFQTVQEISSKFTLVVIVNRAQKWMAPSLKASLSVFQVNFVHLCTCKHKLSFLCSSPISVTTNIILMNLQNSKLQTNQYCFALHGVTV